MALTDTYLRAYDFHDGSHYQPQAGPMDVTALFNGSTKKEGKGPAVCWKVTQSIKYVDPTFAGVRADFARAGFSDRFFYHWLSGTTDYVAQARHYLNTVNFWLPGDRVMLDAEEAGITELGAATWLETVEETTREPSSVYCGLYVAGGSIWRSQRIRMSKYGPRPMHLAAYVSRDSLLTRMRALGVINLPMHFWQYSSNGPVPGITGRADMNNVCDWSMMTGAQRPQPTPEQPPTIPTPQGVILDMGLPIIHNSEQLFDTPPVVGKFVIMDNGKIRHLLPKEYYSRVVASGFDGNHPINVGFPWNNAEIAEAGVWEEPKAQVPGDTILAAVYDISLRLDLSEESATGTAVPR